ncbi:hypothetical protein, unlikely [Trypanosoma brucei gambiense DAL972]|uniref:Uncharacterized protein n=1 Tax=Trypanosoma brucei gambiense (strain MHOM/CI/86/DAL972) TaxID=679716 RepID=C9ZKW0_TRYB9|nr:hypothetical protein, unlikely [Trypanosoma brucei gambiense DAL972]CBH09703.1 hypothetical protein, unlikely [Trypanosoma brucei gambiense DAL972]|eukprot:XP_011771996.1 hypothetical protein, unlikely [Trypanosoma brucei gambiense DAL972]
MIILLFPVCLVFFARWPLHIFVEWVLVSPYVLGIWSYRFGCLPISLSILYGEGEEALTAYGVRRKLHPLDPRLNVLVFPCLTFLYIFVSISHLLISLPVSNWKD